MKYYMNWDEKLDKLLAIAEHAGKAIIEIYESAQWGVESKIDETPLTHADKASNDIICSGLIDLFPDIPLISEENKEIPYPERKDFHYFWLIDPLDGTKEFIKKNGEFTVNIGLVEGNTVIGGVVYAPVFDEMYYAFKGKGAFKVIDGESFPLEVSEFSDAESNLRIISSRSHMNDDTKQFIQKFSSPELISRGSSLKFLCIAEGNAEIYPRLAPTMEWDTAAAQIILEEAGGSIIDVETGKSLKYNKKSLKNPHFVAYARHQK